MGNFVAPSSSIFFFQKSSCKFDTSNLSRSTELKTYVKKTFVMGNVLPRFHGYFFLQKQTRLVKQLFCKLSRREVYVQDFLFLCWTFDFLLYGGIVASCEGELNIFFLTDSFWRNSLMESCGLVRTFQSFKFK